MKKLIYFSTSFISKNKILIFSIIFSFLVSQLLGTTFGLFWQFPNGQQACGVYLSGKEVWLCYLSNDVDPTPTKYVFLLQRFADQVTPGSCWYQEDLVKPFAIPKHVAHMYNPVPTPYPIPNGDKIMYHVSWTTTTQPSSTLDKYTFYVHNLETNTDVGPCINEFYISSTKSVTIMKEVNSKFSLQPIKAVHVGYENKAGEATIISITDPIAEVIIAYPTEQSQLENGGIFDPDMLSINWELIKNNYCIPPQGWDIHFPSNNLINTDFKYDSIDPNAGRTATMPLHVIPDQNQIGSCVNIIVLSKLYTDSNTTEYSRSQLVELIAISPIPTLSQWGLIIFTILLAALGMVFVQKRQTVPAFANNAYSGEKRTLFDRNLFFKVLVVVMLITAAGLGIIRWYFGVVNRMDLFGTLIIAMILAYIVQLLFLIRRNK